MASLLSNLHFDFKTSAILAVVAGALWHGIPWLLDPHGIRSYPGPLLAKFSDLWLGILAPGGHRSEVVHDLHKKHGTFVRIAPNHLSIADPAAIQVIYGHGNGALKSEFYDAFASTQTRGLFNTRSRAEHARKRKIVSHVFSQKSVLEFEPYTHQHVAALIGQWDRLCALALKGQSGTEGEGGWVGRDGRLWLDCLPWYNYLAFDIIGDLAFGTPFGMLQAGADEAPIAMALEGGSDTKETHVHAVQALNERGEHTAAIGVLPLYWWPVLRRVIPWYSKGDLASQRVAGMAAAAVKQRLAHPVDRTDVLGKLQQGKDDEGNPMGLPELISEAMTQMIAGSDTTSNSLCAMTYHLAANPRIQQKLQRELDEALDNDDDAVSTFEAVKRLPYLEAVVNEGLRVHSTLAAGLPRVVPEGGLMVLGQFFPEGTVLSVPIYTVHRDAQAWGTDAEVFRPERWEEGDKDAMQKAFTPFSFGPRACIGRNVAFMELLVTISSVVRRYNFVLEKHEPLQVSEGFMRKPVHCLVGIKRRSA